MTIYPTQWRMRNAEVARYGDVVPLAVKFPPSTEVCPNCKQEPPGVIMGWQVGEGPARTYYGKGRAKFLLGDIVSLPCPVCGGSTQEYLFRTSGIQGKYLDGTPAQSVNLRTYIEQSGNAEALAAVRRFVAGATEGDALVPWLYLSGPNGTGKTHLMWAAVNMIIATDRRVLFSTMKNLLDDLRNSFDEQSKTGSQEVRDRYINVEVLFLDEWEKDNWSDWGCNEAFEILNERGQLNRPTMICSNRSLDELDWDKFRAMISRFQTGIVASISGADMRRTVGHWWDDKD